MNKKMAMLASGMVLTIGLVACPSPTPPVKTDFGQPTTIEGTIIDFVPRPDSPAVIEYREKNGFLAAKANARDDGTFSLVLPSADVVTSKLKESSLVLFLSGIAGGFGEEKDCTGEITLSPVITTYVVTQMGFTQGSFDTDRKISSGTVSITNGKPNIDQDFWIFATSPTQLTGMRSCSDSKSKASLFLKKGWNVANLKLLFDKNEVIIQSIEPAATSWRTNPNFIDIFGF
jgi:hypothetical protein